MKIVKKKAKTVLTHHRIQPYLVDATHPAGSAGGGSDRTNVSRAEARRASPSSTKRRCTSIA